MVDYNRKPESTLQSVVHALTDFERTSRQAQLNAMAMEHLMDKRDAQKERQAKKAKQQSSQEESSLNFEILKKVVSLESRIKEAEDNAKLAQDKTQDLLQRIVQAKNEEGYIDVSKIFLTPEEKYPFAHAFNLTFEDVVNDCSLDDYIENCLVKDFDDWHFIDDPWHRLTEEQKQYRMYWDQKINLRSDVIIFPDWFLRTDGKDYEEIPEAEQCDYLVDIYRTNLKKAVNMWENSYKEYDDLAAKHNAFIALADAYEHGTLHKTREKFFRRRYPEYFETHPAYKFEKNPIPREELMEEEEDYYDAFLDSNYHSPFELDDEEDFSLDF